MFPGFLTRFQLHRKTHTHTRRLRSENMLVQSCIPSSVEVRKQDLCISVLKTYKLQKISLHKSCAAAQVSGIDDSIQSCKLCDPKMSEINSFFSKSRTISQGIGPCQFEFGPVLGPIAAMIKYPDPFISKVRIGEAYQAQVPDWAPPTEVKTDNGGCSDCADSQLKSQTASRKRKQEFSS
ncbi:uncharacterized protein LOC133706440 isoform X2 [Rosa rugosa]|uniref:uncharacterized protein LOC133706440 isoform X2 n=1 Tax=Rosa rugosa TaxID=74645 RepID=UPI002B40FEF8|nr:uncharacterized protein LOC133706440 isoform X2 [Rosa rugosa]